MADPQEQHQGYPETDHINKPEPVFPKLTEDSASNTLYHLLNMAFEDHASLVWITMGTTRGYEERKEPDPTSREELIASIEARRYRKGNVTVDSVGFHYMIKSVMYEFGDDYILGKDKNGDILEEADKMRDRLEDWLWCKDMVGTKYFWQRPQDFIPESPFYNGPDADPKAINILWTAKFHPDRVFARLRDRGIDLELLRLMHEFQYGKVNFDYVIQIQYGVEDK